MVIATDSAREAIADVGWERSGSRAGSSRALQPRKRGDVTRFQLDHAAQERLEQAQAEEHVLFKRRVHPRLQHHVDESHPLGEGGHDRCAVLLHHLDTRFQEQYPVKPTRSGSTGAPSTWALAPITAITAAAVAKGVNKGVEDAAESGRRQPVPLERAQKLEHALGLPPQVSHPVSRHCRTQHHPTRRARAKRMAFKPVDEHRAVEQVGRRSPRSLGSNILIGVARVEPLGRNRPGP
jgi:hypothetical protein